MIHKTLKSRLEAITKSRSLLYGGVAVVVIEVVVILLFAGSLVGWLSSGSTKNPMVNNQLQGSPGEPHWLGMNIALITPAIRAEYNIPPSMEGYVVRNPGSLNDLRQGDVIISINGQPVPDQATFVQVIHTTHAYDGMLLDIYRMGQYYYVTVKHNYPYGPAYGPQKKQWLPGDPLLQQRLPYGPYINQRPPSRR